jgi:ribosome-binding protein aMBF1 (putative translation factor)
LVAFPTHQPYAVSKLIATRDLVAQIHIFVVSATKVSNATVKVIGTNQQAALVALIRAKRRAAGLRQADVAKRLGEKQQWVALIEAGQRRISVVEFIALAKIIGFDPAKAIRKIAKLKN